jgi:hypothetical protein
MKRMVKALAAVLALGLAAPVMAADADDVKDTATEKKAQAKKKLRSMKGSKSAQDRADDAADTATEKKAQAKKSARKAGRKAKQEANEAKEKANEATK